jgi:hypothetical protein
VAAPVVDVAHQYTVGMSFKANGTALRRGDTVVPSEVGITERVLRTMLSTRHLMTKVDDAEDVPESDDDDPNTVAFRATPGETVSVEHPYRHGKRKGKRRG